MYNENKVKRIKELYPKGTEIELISMEDSYAVPSGTHGVVDFVDDMGTIFMNWDNGSTLGLVVGEDKFKIIKKPNLDFEELEKAKDLIQNNDTLSLFTYNKNNENIGVASFINGENKVKVFEGNSDGSDDMVMSYEDFIKNYKFKVSNEYDNPFKDIKI